MENKGHSKLKASGQHYLNFFITPAAAKKIVEQPKVLKFKNQTSIQKKILGEVTLINIINDYFNKLIKKDFTDAQIIIYQKGNKYSLIYSLNSGTSMINAEKFNKMFNSVKRSKSKVFDKEKLLSTNLKSLGPIIAIEFDSLNCQLLFTASRSEFFAPLSGESDTFNSLSIEFHKNIIKAFVLENNILKLNIIKTSMLTGNTPFKIKDSSSTLWMEKKLGPQDNSNPSQFYLKENFILTIFNISLSELNPNLFHHERISLLGELLNTLRHELSNPLFGIQLYLSLWNESVENIEHKELLGHALQCVSKCNNIILNLDTLFKSDSPREEIDIKKFLDDILTVAKSEIRNIPTNIIIKNIENVAIKTHGLSLFHILFNFIINAAQSIKQTNDPTRKNEIEISVTINERNIKIDVADSGLGINPGDISKISSPFYSTKTTGHGIGLNICKMLAEKMGGSISFKNRESEPGAIFSLYLNL